MTGWEPEELIGMPVHEVLHHSRRNGSPCAAEECPIYIGARDRKVMRGEDEAFWRKDGASFPVEYASTPHSRTG